MNILFVCTGNTCRSPMAEEVARVLMRNMGMQGKASSAGIYASEGMPAALGAQAAVAAFGGDLEAHRATQLTRAHIAEADLILTMEAAHSSAVLRIAPGAQGKTHTLLGFSGEEGDIADPFGGDTDVYNNCLVQIGEAVRLSLEKITGRA